MMITVGDSNIEIKLVKTNHKNEFRMGWPEVKMAPEMYLNGKVLTDFKGTEVDCTGCAYVKAGANKKMTKECFDWIIDNLIL